ncbi:MAG: peptidylprolyl isomerase [Thermoguttaceae bacterium]|nr:peptidylprolyl isomerase [Thermoguttaceae bacterium]MDW8077365.1 peptidylprolyl isomerase [Thermoguttaceae bacterium]
MVSSTAGRPGSGGNPVVQVDTNFGSFQIELDRQKAPITVENFLGYVERGQYDQTIIHQVFPKAVILAGAFRVNGDPIRAGPPIFNEATNGLKNLRGTVAMYREPGDPHSATSIFFINVRDNPNFDCLAGAGHGQTGQLATIPAEEYGYCVFGRVIQGMEVVDKIASVPVEDTEQRECSPVQQIVIRSIRWVK